MDGREDLALPVSRRETILKRENVPPMREHPGESCMFGAMRRSYYWPAIVFDVADSVNASNPCERDLLNEMINATPWRILPPSGPTERVAVDVLGHLPRTADRTIFALASRTDSRRFDARVVPLHTDPGSGVGGRAAAMAAAAW